MTSVYRGAIPVMSRRVAHPRAQLCSRKHPLSTADAVAFVIEWTSPAPGTGAAQEPLPHEPLSSRSLSMSLSRTNLHLWRVPETLASGRVSAAGATVVGLHQLFGMPAELSSCTTTKRVFKHGALRVQGFQDAGATSKALLGCRPPHPDLQLHTQQRFCSQLHTSPRQHPTNSSITAQAHTARTPAQRAFNASVSSC